MTLFVVALSPADAQRRPWVVKNLVEGDAIELWPGLWVVDLDSGPETLMHHLAGGATAFIVPVSNIGANFSVGSAAGEKAQVFFYEKIAPILPSFRWEDNMQCKVLFFGDGKARLGPVVERYEQLVNQSILVTPLCRTMCQEGSDKGLGWHNYTKFYTELFDIMMPKPAAIFEVGIGTNDVEVPSNMGSNGVPGASLRGWRAHFPSAWIYGADVDHRILFNEDRISTFYVDQTKPDTLRALWAAIPHVFFDIFIDDGLHDFEASKTTFENSFDRLKPGGIYVIEDIFYDNVMQYEAFFQSTGTSGMIISIKHTTNDLDNTLIIIIKDDQANIL